MANNQPFVGGSDNAGLGSHTSNGFTNIIPPSEGVVTSAPAVGVQAIATSGAVAGRKYICRSISLSLAAQAGVVAGVVRVFLRDGAAGVGTVIWDGIMAVNAAGVADHIFLSGLCIDGTIGNAITLEFLAGFANAFETASLGLTFSTV